MFLRYSHMNTPCIYRNLRRIDSVDSMVTIGYRLKAKKQTRDSRLEVSCFLLNQ